MLTAVSRRRLHQRQLNQCIQRCSQLAQQQRSAHLLTACSRPDGSCCLHCYACRPHQTHTTHTHPHREPVKSKGPLPFHLIPALKRSLEEDKYVADTGNIVFYQKAESF